MLNDLLTLARIREGDIKRLKMCFAVIILLSVGMP